MCLVATIVSALLGCSAPGSMPASTEGTGGTRSGSGSGGSGGSGGSAGSGGSTGGTAGVDAGGLAGEDATSNPLDAGQEPAVMPDGPPATRDAAVDVAPDSRPGPDGTPTTGAYNPCPPAGKPCVALPIGDSLTQGAGSSGGGYRREFFRQVVAHGQSITFVGSRASGPAMLDGVNVPFPRNHEGHGGFTIQNLSVWIRDNNTITTYKPDVVMLQIGINNGLRHPGANISAALGALGALIDQILAADPRLLLIVAQIPPSSTAEGIKNVEAYNAGIPGVVAARAAAGKHVMTADVHKAFVANPNWKTAYLPGSDVHPNDAGYDAIGRGWYSALGPLLR